MERVLSIGERLQRLLEEAEREADRKIAEARRRSEEMISEAKEEAENRRIRARRGDGIEGLIRAEEENARKESTKIMEDYKDRAEKIRKVSPGQLEEAVNLVLAEVLPR